MKKEEKIRKSEDRSQKTGVRRPKSEVARLNDKVGQGSRKPEAGNRKPEAGSKGQGAESQPRFDKAPRDARLPDGQGSAAFASLPQPATSNQYPATGNQYPASGIGLSFAPEKSGQAVDFSQRIKEDTKREENIEYRISNIESGSGANNMVSHSLFLIPYSLFIFSAKDNSEQRAGSTGQGARSRAIGCRGFRTAIIQVRIGIRTTLKKEIQQFSINNSPSTHHQLAGLGEPLIRRFEFAGNVYQLNF